MGQQILIDLTMKSKKLYPVIGLATFSSPLEVGADRAEKVLSRFKEVLKGNNFRIIEVGDIGTPEESAQAGVKLYDNRVDVLLAIPVCWHEDYLLLDILEDWNGPVFMWPQPGMQTGALCGAQQNMAFLKRLGHTAEYTFGEVEDSSCIAKAIAFIRAAAIRKKMRHSKIGLLGHRVPGMTHTYPDEFSLKQSIGSRVVQLDLPELLEKSRKNQANSTKELWKKVKSCAGKCLSKDSDGIYSITVYSLLKKLVEKHDLDALAVGCYPQLMGKVCLAASLLADEGVPLACEGDINGAVAMLILSILSEGGIHNGDWLEPVDDETVLFTHCGSGSFSLAKNREEITLQPVRLMKQGVCAQFTSKPGPVTLLNLTPGKGDYTCGVLEGEALNTEMLFPGNPLRVRFEKSPLEINDWIFETGLGHHWMAAYGNFSKEIKFLGKMNKNLNIVTI